MAGLFSQGLVNVEVSSEVENFLVVDEQDPTAQPVLGRHITIREKILEVDGSKVRQSVISEHVVDVYNNGTIIRSTSEPSLDSQITADGKLDICCSSNRLVSGDIEPATSPCDGSEGLLQMMKASAWDEEDVNTAALAGFSVAFSLAFLYFIVALVRRRRQNSAYAPVSSGDCPPGYNAKDAAIFSADFKKASEVNEVTEVDERVTLTESLTSNQE